MVIETIRNIKTKQKTKKLPQKRPHRHKNCHTLR